MTWVFLPLYQPLTNKLCTQKCYVMESNQHNMSLSTYRIKSKVTEQVAIEEIPGAKGWWHWYQNALHLKNKILSKLTYDLFLCPLKSEMFAVLWAFFLFPTPFIFYFVRYVCFPSPPSLISWIIAASVAPSTEQSHLHWVNRAVRCASVPWSHDGICKSAAIALP